MPTKESAVLKVEQWTLIRAWAVADDVLVRVEAPFSLPEGPSVEGKGAGF